MAKTAKIGLTADVRGFKKQMEEAKSALSAIGNANISSQAEKKIAAIFSSKLQASAAGLQGQIKNVTSEIEKMVLAGDDAFNTAKIQEMGTKLDVLKRKYQAVNEAQKEIGRGKLTPTGGESGSGGMGGMLRGGMGFMGKALGAVGVGLGVNAILNKRDRMADERLKIRPLTTDNQLGGETSRLGFSPTERRETQFQIATQTQVTGKALTELTDMAEQLERGFGVSREETAGAIGVSRRAGGQDPGKMVAQAIGTAVAARLEGSKVGEYLQAMTGFMEQMSQSINVDTNSLNGFAGALARLPFFKNDPSRIFTAIKSMDTSFRSADRFNQAQAARAILRTPGAMGASPAAVEMRRQMGLFGSVDRDTMGDLKKAGFTDASLKALGSSGGDIVQNQFKDIMASTEGMSAENRAFAFGDRLGLDPGQALPMFGKIAAAEKEGKATDSFFDDMAEQIKEATMDPQKLLADRMKQLDKTFANGDGKIKDLSAKIERLGEIITQNLAGAIVELASTLEKMVTRLGGGADAVETAANAGTVGAAVAGGMVAGKFAKGAGKLLGKAVPKGAGKAAGNVAGKVLGKTGAKIGGKALAKATPIIGTLVSAGFAVKDAYDIISKYVSGDDITNKDMAILTADVAAMVPFIGAGGAIASAGFEMMDDDAMGTFHQGSKSKEASGGGGVLDGLFGGGGGTPTDSMPPAMGPDGKFSSIPPAGKGGQVINFPSGVVLDNTSAIRELTATIKGGGGGSRFPSNAQKMNRSGMATGK